jgi:hypothetical protein
MVKAVTSLITGNSQAKAAQGAANAQIEAANQARNSNERIFEKQTALQAPFRDAGITANNKLLDLLGLSGKTEAEGYNSLNRDFGIPDFEKDPGYAFRLSEGLKALERTASARGGLISGSALKAAQRYGQNEASNEYQNAFNRFQVNRTNKLAPLQSLTGASQNATNTLTNAAGNLGQLNSELITGAGNARASGYIGRANARARAVGQAVDSFSLGMNAGGFF